MSNLSRSKPRAVRRKSFQKQIGQGKRFGVPVRAEFEKYSNGHILLLNVQSPGGMEDHAWINSRAATMIPPLHRGDKIKFLADLQAYFKNDGSLSVRLECVREVSVFSEEVA